MLLRLFLLFTVIPLVEVLLLFKISDAIGFGPTLVLVLGTGFVGAALARAQGFLALSRVRLDLAHGKLPTKSLGDSVMILIAGVLLVTPGVLTDLVGLALLISPIRAGIRVALTAWLSKRVQVTTQGFWEAARTNDPHDGGPPGRGKVIDVQVVETHTIDEPAGRRPAEGR